MEQLIFPLSPKEPYGFRYFVPHSGVSDAYQDLSRILESFQKDQSQFYLATVIGPKGSGKSHMVQAFAARARQSDGGSDKVRCFDFEQTPDDGSAASLVAAYEELRKYGGILLVALCCELDDPQLTPHIASRLKTGASLVLSYPSEDELGPLIGSLLERHNLQLSESSISYLVKRLPRDPLSFNNIFAKISDLSLQQGKPARIGVIRDVVARDSDDV